MECSASFNRRWYGVPLATLSDSGGIRDRIVVIGPRRGSLDEARFIPPPYGDSLGGDVQALFKWIEDPPNLPTVVQAALAHYQFETLHPYSDGNGRLGRLLIIVQLLRGALIREPLLVVSPWFEERRVAYQDALFELSCDGEWDTWVAFFAEGVASSASESQRKVERLVELQAELRATVQNAGKRGVAERLAGDLVGLPYLSRGDVVKRYGLSGQGATNAISTLIELGVLEPAGLTNARGGKMFVAHDVVRLVSS